MCICSLHDCGEFKVMFVLLLFTDYPISSKWNWFNGGNIPNAQWWGAPEYSWHSLSYNEHFVHQTQGKKLYFVFKIVLNN